MTTSSLMHWRCLMLWLSDSRHQPFYLFTDKVMNSYIYLFKDDEYHFLTFFLELFSTIGGIKSSPLIPSILMVVVDLRGVFTFFSFFFEILDFYEFLLRCLLSFYFLLWSSCSYYLSFNDCSVLFFERHCLAKLLLFLLGELLYLNYTADFCFFFYSSSSLYCLITSLIYLRTFFGFDFFSVLFGVFFFFFSLLFFLVFNSSCFYLFFGYFFFFLSHTVVTAS